MGRRGKVGLLLRVKEGYVKPVWEGSRLKPLIGLINGREEYRADGIYYLRYTDNGKTRMENARSDHVEVMTFRDRRLAILELQTKAKAEGLALVNPDAQPEVQGRVTIQAAITAYIERLRRNKKYEPTVKAKQSELAEFARFCRRRFMDQLTHDDMIDYREHLKGKKLQDQTVFNKLICIVTWQRRNPLFSITGLLDFPDDYPEQKPTVPEPFTAKEIALLKQCATPQERLILNMFLATSCRDQEIAHLEYTDLNFANNTVRIQKKDFLRWKPKSRAGTRNLPISAALLAQLKATPAID